MTKALPKRRPSHWIKHQIKLVCLLLIGLGLLAYAAFYLWSWYDHTHGTATPPNPRQIITTSSLTPDEKPVPSDAAADVPADQPKRLIISSIGVDGFIQRVGPDRQGAIGTPTNTNYAGWFVGSAKPGDNGLSIIDGHVSARYGSALFARLGELQSSDTVTVQFGDASIRRFAVVETRQLSKAETAHFLLSQRADISQQLNLVTCAGRFDKTAREYTHRIVVVTKRLN